MAQARRCAQKNRRTGQGVLDFRNSRATGLDVTQHIGTGANKKPAGAIRAAGLWISI
jgi:hypothetical protein